MAFSPKLLKTADAKNVDALKRIELAKARVQKVLDRERVAHQKTLEQKISDQGPSIQRVDPHLLGLAIMDLKEQNRLNSSTHKATGSQTWYSNRLTKHDEIAQRLELLAPIYADTLNASNHVGDALEIITEKAIAKSFEGQKRHTYQGHFLLEEPRDKHGRYTKLQPPKNIGPHSTLKEADFIIFGYDQGPLCIECKNYREWFYPHHNEIKSTIIKSYELGAIPVFVGRRIHYTTRENFFAPAGIVFHESFHQYYDPIHANIAEQAKDKTLLGFSDIRASHDPEKRTIRFFADFLPSLIEKAEPLWAKARDSAYDYAKNKMNLAQLYTEIGSPAGGKWVAAEEPPPF